MARKRYTPPEVVLRRVIEGLEQEHLAKQRAAIELLLTDGPLRATDTLQRERDQPATFPVDTGVMLEVDLVRAELLAVLRGIVRYQDSTYAGHGITLHGPLRLFPHASGEEVRFLPDAASALRDIVIFQLVLLLHIVGLRNIRKCDAPDCERLYVKTYRRLYCSPRCQKRVKMREYRREDKTREAQKRQARERRRREGARA